MFYRSGWLRCVGFKYVVFGVCVICVIILLLLYISYTILFSSSDLFSLPNIPLFFYPFPILPSIILIFLLSFLPSSFLLIFCSPSSPHPPLIQSFPSSSLSSPNIPGHSDPACFIGGECRVVQFYLCGVRFCLCSELVLVF